LFYLGRRNVVVQFWRQHKIAHIGATLCCLFLEL
jgi:hypothetical protein